MFLEGSRREAAGIDEIGKMKYKERKKESVDIPTDNDVISIDIDID